LPTLLAPDWWTTVTQQPALLESYILRAVGISLVILAWLEFRIIRGFERLFFVTIVVQTLLRSFNGAQWYW
jgi:hypothetical protein